MSECDRYLEMISELVDGELPEPQKTELFEHLESCDYCRRAYDAFSAISLSLGETAAPEGFANGVMAAVRTQGGTGSKRARRPGKSPVRYMALAACLILAVLAAVRLALPSEGNGVVTSDGPQAAQFGMAAAPGELDPRDLETGGSDQDEEAPQNSLTVTGESSPAEGGYGQDDGVSPQVYDNGLSLLPFDADEITSISVNYGQSQSTITDGENILIIASLLSPAGDAQKQQALGEAYCSLGISYADGFSTVDIFLAGDSLVCKLDGEDVYYASGSTAELLDALD